MFNKIKYLQSVMNYQEIARTIKPITEKQAINDLLKLKNVNIETINHKSRLGQKFVDYFTFCERLNTKGKRGISFFDFVDNVELYIDKPYYRKFLDWLDINRADKPSVCKYYELYRIYFSAITSFTPITAMMIYNKYKPTKILDPFCGWGGRLVGACVSNVDTYIGIDTNYNLVEPYNRMINILLEEHISTSLPDVRRTNIEFINGDCSLVDYSVMDYDCVFTSPPYYNIEIYSGCPTKKSKKEWDELYSKVFVDTYRFLKPNGIYILNIPKSVLRIAKKILGEPTETFVIPKQSRCRERGKDYQEVAFVWIKRGDRP
jgi:hypothetical protein